MSNKGGRVSPDYLADIAPEYAKISTTLDLYVHPNFEQKQQCVEQMFRRLR